MPEKPVELPPPPMTVDELNTLVNLWPVRSLGWYEDRLVIDLLDALGRRLGYGRLKNLVEGVADVQCYARSDRVAGFKRRHLADCGYPLPDDFEEVAARCRQREGK